MATEFSDENSNNGVVIRDRAQRRRFMRKGAAFVAAAGVVATSSRAALAADCDRGGPGGKKPEHGGNGSDSDTGDNADPTGCGRNYTDKPKISQSSPEALPGETKPVIVAKVTAS